MAALQHYSVGFMIYLRLLHLYLILIFTVRMLREELQLLQEPGSYVGEVVKVMGKNKVLVKVGGFVFFSLFQKK